MCPRVDWRRTWTLARLDGAGWRHVLIQLRNRSNGAEANSTISDIGGSRICAEGRRNCLCVSRPIMRVRGRRGPTPTLNARARRARMAVLTASATRNGRLGYYLPESRPSRRAKPPQSNIRPYAKAKFAHIFTLIDRRDERDQIGSRFTAISRRSFNGQGSNCRRDQRD